MSGGQFLPVFRTFVPDAPRAVLRTKRTEMRGAGQYLRKMDIEEVREYCLTLPGVTEDMPYGPDWVVFRIGGKIFLHISLARRLIAIKLRPEHGEALRDRFEAVRPAWHMNKRHWNDIDTEGTFPREVIEAWIRESYSLVLVKLPKAEREKYASLA